MVTDVGKQTDSRATPDRWILAKNCLDSIRSSSTLSGRPFNHLEQTSLNRAEIQLQKLAASRNENGRHGLGELSADDSSFADRFLEFFSAEAFSVDLDALRQSEGSNMSESDFSTLADSINSFGLGMSSSDKEILVSHLDIRS